MWSIILAENTKVLKGLKNNLQTFSVLRKIESEKEIKRRFAMIIMCPTCKKLTTWEENPDRPFCSRQCQRLDYKKWISEEFKIPIDEIPDKREENSDSN